MFITNTSDIRTAGDGHRQIDLSCKPPSQRSLFFYIGGGGWIAQFQKVQERFLRGWMQDLDCDMFELFYKLAPENKYPSQLDDVVNGYLGVLYYYKYCLGVEPKKIILMGDSAGGNLVAALTNYLILGGYRVPDFNILAYPGINVFNCSL